MFIRSLKVLSILIIFYACSHNPVKDVSEHNFLGATTYVQTAAEYRALQVQAYQIATQQLDRLAKIKSNKTKAIVLDLDETVLDNSPYQAKNILEKKSYTSESWREWVELAQAKAISGAKEFLTKAKKMGFEIFYISNRKIAGLEATYKNLKSLDLPVKKSQILLKEKTSDKTARRNIVSKKYNIVLLMGDNLGDFDEVFQSKSIAERFNLVKSKQALFGRKFIVFPNPMYGEWESALYNYKRGLTSDEKTKKALGNLRSY